MTFLSLFVFLAQSTLANDWPQWRGPSGDNHADADATAPIKWGDASNLAWVTPVPGRGHASPTIVGDRIYLITADAEAQTQSLLIYDRRSGKQLLEQVVHRGGLNAKLDPNNTHASSTVASDGQRVFTLFLNDHAAWVTGFDLDGNQRWQQRAIGFDPKLYEFGFGSSPIVVDGLVIVSSEYDGPESGFVALDAATGEQRWKVDRPQALSYSSLARMPNNGRTELIISGGEMFAAYDPQNGNQLWSIPGSAPLTCGTMVWHKKLGLAFGSGGWPNKFLSAVRIDGDHEVIWNHKKIKCYEQSILVAGDFLYSVDNNGIAYCHRCADGEQMWKKRLGGNYSSSPLLVEDRIYVTNEAGTTYVYEATPAGYQPVAQNQLGTECFATPAPLDGRLYHRYADGFGENRQEYLAAIGK